MIHGYQISFDSVHIEYVLWKEDTDKIFKAIHKDSSKDEVEFHLMKEELKINVKNYTDYRLFVNQLGFIEQIIIGVTHETE